jgi:hypothetical protein
MIYTHLVPTEVLLEPQPEWVAEEEDPAENLLLAYFGDSNYFSPKFSRELRETHYQSSYFNFGTNIEAIPRFRIRDIWNVGFTPADAVMTIGVSLTCHTYDFDGLIIPDSIGWDDWEGPLVSRDDLLARLEMLFGFRRGTKIDVYLDIDRRYLPSTLDKGQWTCDTVVPIILPTLRRLAIAGVTVNICLEKDVCELSVETGEVTLEEIKEQFKEVTHTLQGNTRRVVY